MKLIIYGKPQAKQRARTCRYGTYTPKPTIDYENLIKTEFLRQCKRPSECEYLKPIKMQICAYFVPNKSISKKKFNSLIGQPHISRPDTDNIR